MSRSCRPYTPPLALATLNAASMPIFIFWPSSLAGPVNGAEIPNLISLSVTPRTALLLSCDDFEIGESAACWPCAAARGAAPGVATIPAVGTSARVAGASFSVSGSDGLATCVGGESGSSTATRCKSGFPNMTNNAMTAANAATVTKRPISASNPSAHHAGGSGTGSGLKGIIRRSRCSSSDQGAIDVEVLTDRSRSDVAGCSRAHLGEYLRSSESSLGLLIITLAAADQI